MASRHPQLSDPTTVKSLIRRFESLSSYHSVPSLPIPTVKEVVVGSAQVPRRASSAIMAATHLTSLLPLLLDTNTFPRAHTTPSESTPDTSFPPRATRKRTSITTQNESTQQCSAPRLALRRISQSVKRKASFFIEHSQKAEDLPLRKSPPPKRLFGENLGRKVSKKVMEKFDVQINRQRHRTRLLESGLRDFRFDDEDWLSSPADVESPHKRSSGDGAGDIGTTCGSTHVSTAEDMSRGSQERSSFATEESTRSSTSYPLRAPATPPVMKRVPKQFAQNLRHRVPTGAGDNTASAQDYPVYQAGPQRTPEVRNVPPRLRRGESSAAEVLPGSKCTTIASRTSSIGSRRSNNHNDRRRRWSRWNKNTPHAKKSEDAAVMPQPPPPLAKKITPPKISVRSLIAKFKGTERTLEPNPPPKRQPRNRVELQFDEPTEEVGLGEKQRSISIRTYSTDPRRAKASAFTFVSPTAPTDTQNSQRPNNVDDESNTERRNVPVSRKSVRSFLLQITAGNDGSDGDWIPASGTDAEHHTLIDGPLSQKAEEMSMIHGLGSRSSSSMYTSTPPSLTTAETINSRKRTSRLQRVHNRGDASGEDSGFSTIGESDVRIGTGLSGFITADESEVYTYSSLATPDDSRKAGSRMSGVSQQSNQKRPVYEYQAYKPPDVATVYTQHALRPLSGLRKSTAYKGTPAPASFLRNRGGNSTHEDSSLGERSGETSTTNEDGYGRRRTIANSVHRSGWEDASEHHLDGGYLSSPYLGYEGDAEDGTGGKTSGFTELEAIEGGLLKPEKRFRLPQLWSGLEEGNGVAGEGSQKSTITTTSATLRNSDPLSKTEPRFKKTTNQVSYPRALPQLPPPPPPPIHLVPLPAPAPLPLPPPPPPPPAQNQQVQGQRQYHHYRQYTKQNPQGLVLPTNNITTSNPEPGSKPHEPRVIPPAARWSTHLYHPNQLPTLTTAPIPPAPPPHIPPITHYGNGVRDLDAPRLMKRLLMYGYEGGPTAVITKRLYEKVTFPMVGKGWEKPVLMPKPKNAVLRVRIEAFVRAFS